MGIYSGSVSYTRFRVVQAGKRPTIGVLDSLIDPFKAPHFTLESSPKPETVGWVKPLAHDSGDTLHAESDWSVSDSIVSGGILFRVKIERRLVPGSLLQMVFRQKLMELTKSHSKPLSRAEKSNLKESVAADLMKRSLPQIKFVDLFWRDMDQELYIFSQSKTLTNKALQLFSKTFADGLELSFWKLNAAVSWAEQTQGNDRISLISKIEPAVFARQKQ